MAGEFQSFWAEEVLSTLGRGLGAILLNNLLVLVALWIMALGWWWCFRKDCSMHRQAALFAAIAYLFFFGKEAVRINGHIAAFSGDFDLPYRLVLAILVLPHGLIEMCAFICAAFCGVIWLRRAVEAGRLAYPGHALLLVPAVLVGLAAVVESYLTPYLFWLYLIGK